MSSIFNFFYSIVGLTLSWWQTPMCRKYSPCGLLGGRWSWYECRALKSFSELKIISCKEASVSIHLFLAPKLGTHSVIERGLKNVFFSKKERKRNMTQASVVWSHHPLCYSLPLSLQSVPKGASRHPAAYPWVKVILKIKYKKKKNNTTERWNSGVKVWSWMKPLPSCTN